VSDSQGNGISVSFVPYKLANRKSKHIWPVVCQTVTIGKYCWRDPWYEYYYSRTSCRACKEYYLGRDKEVCEIG
jgi:hypothetical protein